MYKLIIDVDHHTRHLADVIGLAGEYDEIEFYDLTVSGGVYPSEAFGGRKYYRIFITVDASTKDAHVLIALGRVEARVAELDGHIQMQSKFE